MRHRCSHSRYSICVFSFVRMVDVIAIAAVYAVAFVAFLHISCTRHSSYSFLQFVCLSMCALLSQYWHLVDRSFNIRWQIAPKLKRNRKRNQIEVFPIWFGQWRLVGFMRTNFWWPDSFAFFMAMQSIQCTCSNYSKPVEKKHLLNLFFISFCIKFEVRILDNDTALPREYHNYLRKVCAGVCPRRSFVSTLASSRLTYLM